MAPDEIIHQSTRLRLMAALDAAEADEPLDFSRLKAVLQVTDGNLGAHVGTLEDAGYVTVTKTLLGKRTRTSVAITGVGRAAFLGHLAYLRGILDAARIDDR